jgi:hypothetical protein
MRTVLVLMLVATIANADTSAAEKKWRTDTESALADDHKSHTPKLIAACGHDLAVTFDWTSLKQADWPERRGIAYMGPSSWAGNVMWALEALCGDAEYSAYKAKAAKIKTLVVHGRACKDLPRDFPGGDAKSPPGVDYKLSASKLEQWVCNDSSVSNDGDAKHWLRGKL